MQKPTKSLKELGELERGVLAVVFLLPVKGKASHWHTLAAHVPAHAEKTGDNVPRCLPGVGSSVCNTGIYLSTPSLEAHICHVHEPTGLSCHMGHVEAHVT